MFLCRRTDKGLWHIAIRTWDIVVSKDIARSVKETAVFKLTVGVDACYV